jgi:hypothetical protein
VEAAQARAGRWCQLSRAELCQLSRAELCQLSGRAGERERVAYRGGEHCVSAAMTCAGQPSQPPSSPQQPGEGRGGGGTS